MDAIFDDSIEKKTITVTIECSTNKSDSFIKDKLRRGVLRGLDTSGCYIAPPSQIHDLTIEVNEKKVGLNLVDKK